MANIFISHSSKDKQFARKLAETLRKFGHKPWLDEWEIKVGECIPTKIEEGLMDTDYVVLVLTKNSINSNWVDKEWKAKYWEEIHTKDTIILPILLEDCKIPELLKTKKYANFKEDFSVGMVELMGSISPVIKHEVNQEFNENFETKSLDFEISKLITKIQKREIPLSQIIIEALELARSNENLQLEQFCRNELTGWDIHNAKNIDETRNLQYREAEVYVSPRVQINMQYFGWGESASNIFEYIRNNNKDFFPKKWFVIESISTLEAKPKPDIQKSILSFTVKASDIMPNIDSKFKDLPMYCYGHSDIYINVLENVRRELTKILLYMLPKISTSDFI